MYSINMFNINRLGYYISDKDKVTGNTWSGNLLELVVHSHKPGRVRKKALAPKRGNLSPFPTVLWPEQPPKPVTNLQLGIGVK